MRNKLLNIHYVGGNGGEFFATMMQNHPEFNFHEGCTNDTKSIKYEFRRDQFDNLSQYYLGWGEDENCLTNYSPKQFFEELWNTSPDKWTIRVDHGYGFITQPEEWTKGLYSDWNVSKTIILNCTEPKGATYCRDLCYYKVFGVDDYKIYQNHSRFVEDNNIKPEKRQILYPEDKGKGGSVMFFNKTFALERIGNQVFKYRPEIGDFWTFNPLKFNLDLTKEYIDLIPEEYDYLEVDPMKLLHTEDEEEREEQLIRIFDYLGLDYSILDKCMLLCEKYMKDNKRVYQKTFLEGYTKQQASKRFSEVFQNKIMENE